MREREHEFSDEGGLHKFRTEIPNTVIRGLKSRDLSVHAKWLYVYFKSVCGDRAECYRTTSTIAEESGLSRTMVSTGKRELIDKGLIVLTKSKNPNRQPDHVRIKNIWDANMQEFSVPLANALHEENDKELKEEAADSVLLANAETGQRSISERSVLLANASVLLANQRRSLEEDPQKKTETPPPIVPPPTAEGVGVEVGHDSTAVLFNQPLKDGAKEVLGYLNQVTGITYRRVSLIESILSLGYTVEQCTLVIDWWDKVWAVERPTQRGLFDDKTPFRRENFETYFPKAQAWHDQGRPPTQAAERATKKPTGAQALAKFVQGVKQ